jgi:hypothetical protein
MNLQLTSSHFEKIIKGGYSLDIVFLLKLAEEGYDIQGLCSKSEKLGVIYSTIARKGLITEDDKITLSGKAVLDFLNEENTEGVDLRKKKDITDDFEKWWKAYPGTDTFTHAGRKFTGSRGLRVKKDECKEKLYKILDEGEYTVDELIKALEFEVMQKMNNSLKTGVNKMTFMQNSLTYLNQRTFEPFIELIREGQKEEIVTPVSGSTDI